MTNHDSGRQADTKKIVISPAMLDAGHNVLEEFDVGPIGSPDEFLSRLFQRMELACRQADPQGLKI